MNISIICMEILCHDDISYNLIFNDICHKFSFNFFMDNIDTNSQKALSNIHSPVTPNGSNLMSSYQDLTTKIIKKSRPSKKRGQHKKELETENANLKSQIIEMERRIGTIEAQNMVLKNQLSFFQSQLQPDGISKQ